VLLFLRTPILTFHALLSLGTAPATYYQSDSRQLGIPPLTGSGSVRRSGVRDRPGTNAGFGAAGRQSGLAFIRGNAIQLPPPIPSSRPGSSSGGPATSPFSARRPGTAGVISLSQPHGTYAYPGQPPGSSGGMGSVAPVFGARQHQYHHNNQHQQQQFAAQLQYHHLQPHVSSESPFSFHAPEPDAAAATAASASYHGQQQFSQQGEYAESVHRGTKRPRADSDAGYGGGDTPAAAARDECSNDDRCAYERRDGHFELSRERERGGSSRPQSRRLAVMELCDVRDLSFW
jgi:hypothetical protein